MENKMINASNSEFQLYLEKAESIGLRTEFETAADLVGDQSSLENIFERIARYRHYNDDEFKSLMTSKHGNILDAMSSLRVRRVKSESSGEFEYRYKDTQSEDLYVLLREAQADADELIETHIEEPWKYEKADTGFALLTHGYRKFYNFTGRSTRAEYWTYYLAVIVGIFSLALLSELLSGIEAILMPLTLIFWIISLLGYIAISVRRLHDIGRSGWWYLISNIPLVGLILLVWACQKGQQKRNDYGNPRAKNAAELNEQLMPD